MDEKELITQNKEMIKAIESLSDNDLESLASGKITSKAKEVLKWVGIGVGGAVTIIIAGMGIAAFAGKKNYGNPLHYFGNKEMDRRLN